MQGREIRLASRPHGWPTADNFALATVDVPEPGPGQVLVRNTLMSVDPYMRGRMNDVESYVPPFAVGAPLDGAAVGEVVASRKPGLSAGHLVLHGLGWRDYAVVDSAVRIDPAPAPPSAYLGVLGTTGLTAYVGLTVIAGVTPGDVVFVSGAAGAVGSATGQLAKLLGASRVIGSAGTAAKLATLRELGFDAVFDYHDGRIADRLREAGPDGIDVYFDNVGGDHLEAAVSAMHDYGRVAACGAISQYNATEGMRGPANYMSLLVNRASMAGFLVFDYFDRYGEAAAEMAGWLADGRLKTFEDIVPGGIEAFPETFLRLFRGENTGKLMLEVATG
jgi:NADPH-dependent curcumin reductase CurA